MSSSHEYEFSERENEIIGDTGKWAQYLAVVFFLTAAAQLFDGLNIIGLAINAVIGYAFWKSSEALKLVVDTEGEDVSHLMRGLNEMATAFQIRTVITIIAMVIVGLLAGAFFVLGPRLFS